MACVAPHKRHKAAQPCCPIPATVLLDETHATTLLSSSLTDKGPRLAARVPCKDNYGWVAAERANEIGLLSRLFLLSSACQVSAFSFHLDSNFTTLILHPHCYTWWQWHVLVRPSGDKDNCSHLLPRISPSSEGRPSDCHTDWSLKNEIKGQSLPLHETCSLQACAGALFVVSSALLTWSADDTVRRGTSAATGVKSG